MSCTLAMALCGSQLEVALKSPKLRGVSSIRLSGGRPRSTLLLAAVDLLTEDAGVEKQAIDRVVVGRGPGSFTGIRSALATALGMKSALNAEIFAFNSLLMQAGRVLGESQVWAAQPGRKGEVYAQGFNFDENMLPVPLDEPEILVINELSPDSKWVAYESLDIGPVPRASPSFSAAESLLRLVDSGFPFEAPEALYIEGPPIHGRNFHAES